MASANQNQAVVMQSKIWYGDVQLCTPHNTVQHVDKLIAYNREIYSFRLLIR